LSVSKQIIEILKLQKIDIIALHPCAKIQKLYSLAHESFQCVNITKEEEGVGICAGISLGGLKPAMLIQSTGLGNMINALCSLTLTFQLPLLILSSWRGMFQEDIIAQKKLGESIPGILESIGIKYQIIKSEDEILRIAEAAENAFNSDTPVVILLSPQLFSAEAYDVPESKPEMVPVRKNWKLDLPERKEGELTRIQLLEIIATHLDEKIVVCNIGLPSRELYQIKHQLSNFYMLGSLGLASSIGMGVALTTTQQVVVIDGDGSLLSNLGSLATIAQIAPENLTILAIDNGVHGSTGNQKTATSGFSDLAYTASGLGIRNVYRARNQNDLDTILTTLDSGPNFIHVLAQKGNAQVPVIPLSPEEIKFGFMNQIKKSRL
jgi:sulfopyruvate decarboxylase beta subunit